MIPFLLKSFNIFMVWIGLSKIPTQLPLTNTLVPLDKTDGLHSVNSFKDVLALIHLIIG